MHTARFLMRIVSHAVYAYGPRNDLSFAQQKGPRNAEASQNAIRFSRSLYSQSERAASSATTTQLVCSCRIEAGHSGVTGP